MLVGQRVAGGGRVVRDVSARRLVVEPLADVALGGAGGVGQLSRGERPGARHRLVQTQLVADVHQGTGDRHAHVGDGLVHERFELLVVDPHHVLRGRGCPRPRGARSSGRPARPDLAVRIRAVTAARTWVTAGVTAEQTRGDRPAQVLAEARVRRRDAAEAVADPGGDRLAGPFGVVAEPAVPAAESDRRRQLADQELAFGVRRGGAGRVPGAVGLVEDAVELVDAGPVARPGGRVEHRVGAQAACRRAGVTGAEQGGGRHLPALGAEQTPRCHPGPWRP